MDERHVLRWVVDVDPLWSGIASPSTRPLTSTWAHQEEVQRSLERLSPEESSKVLHFRFVSDAKMSLASCLLKRRAIANICEVPWSEVVVSQDRNKKPCYVPENTAGKTLEFNVSHHGSLVGLVACSGTATKLGVDIVSMNWEKDLAKVARDGFASWARIYEAVFSDCEVEDIIRFEPPEREHRETATVDKIRHCYAHWCMKEAYVKMTGEALLAPWLKDLEFRKVRTPRSASDLGSSSEWGEAIDDAEIWFYGKRVTGVRLEIQAFRDDHMVAVAASDRSVDFLPYAILDLETDILA